MRIVIVHYHLRPGGVTRVIQHMLAALAAMTGEDGLTEDMRVLVLTSEPPTPSMPISSDYAIIEGLKYSTSSNFSVEQISAQLETTATEKLGGPPDVWHVHNHSLAKNLIVPEIVYHLAKKGRPLLLHIHDLAEDGRPNNYKLLRDYFGDSLTLGAHVYPQAPHIHYSFINHRDLNFFKATNMKETQLHSLPDPIELEDQENADLSRKNNTRLFLYPTRAIRRKNLGEFLFWSTFAENEDRFAVTRSPKNPLQQPIYNDWVAFAQALDLPVDFALGERWSGDFTNLLQSARFLVSTSISEGFGLAFLEPWLAGRPLVGRKLPEITNAFEKAGIDLSGLYDKLLIPTEWVGQNRVYQEVQTRLTQAYEAYGRTVTSDDIERAVQAIITGDYIDFGRLNEPLQKSVIERIVREPSLKKETVPLTLEPSGDYASLISQNCELVKGQYNLHQYGKRLYQIYQAVAGSETGPISGINADKLLDKYLAPERFWLLNT